jgi:hypothetical protein
MLGSLTITYQGPGKRPLSVATIDDPDLLRAAARVALDQAEQRVALLAKSDPVMARLQAAEVERLRAALEILVPDLSAATEDKVSVQ